jgi:hypothetical protein
MISSFCFVFWQYFKSSFSIWCLLLSIDSLKHFKNQSAIGLYKLKEEMQEEQNI